MTPTTDRHADHAARHEANNTQVVWLIGNLLRLGVIVSLSLVVLGVVLTFMHHPEYLRSAESLRELTNGGAALPQTLGELRSYVSQAGARAVVLAGLLVLIATPVLRVLVSMVVFIRQRDWTYAALTLTVLVLLAVSLLSGLRGKQADKETGSQGATTRAASAPQRR